MYGLAAEYIFGSWTHAGKVMGLAPFGDPAGLNDRPIVTLTSSGIEVDTDWLVGAPRLKFSENFENLPSATNIAAKVQAELETGMMHLCRILRARTSCKTICLTGGVALNSVFNGRLAKEGLFERVIVSPASHDAGTAIGAAAYGYRQVTGQQLRFRDDPEFLGHAYSEQEVLHVLEGCPEVDVVYLEKPIEAAAQELAAGKIVGWFEGEAEFGPRALGHRSILADPRVAGMKDRLNRRVKFRESFRPYAAAVLEECCADWFEEVVESPHMLMVAAIRPEKRNLIPAVCHVDNTCRLQTVGREYQGSLRALIEAFLATTGIPLLLNTSLNIHGQPISETPKDALDCLVRSGLDVLYCGKYRVEKRKAITTIHGIRESRAIPSASYYLVSKYEAEGEDTQLTECWIRQGSRQLVVTEKERDFLMKATGCKTVANIVSEMPGQQIEEIIACVESLLDRGILQLRADSQHGVAEGPSRDNTTEMLKR
jgi:carbamoyltransferase